MGLDASDSSTSSRLRSCNITAKSGAPETQKKKKISNPIRFDLCGSSIFTFAMVNANDEGEGTPDWNDVLPNLVNPAK
jgi:hypothetical protein